MNILFYNDIPCNPKFGGTERVTDIIIKELLSRKHYNVVMLCAKTNDSELLNYNFPAKVVSMPYDGGFRNKGNVDFYCNLLKSEQIDIVVNQRAGSPTMNKVLDINGIKTISVIHASIDWWERFMMQRINFLVKTPLGYLKYGIKQLIFPLYKIYKQYTFKKQSAAHYPELLTKSAAVVVLSNNYIKDLKKFANDNSCPILTIPNPNQYNEQVNTEKANTVLYVGRLTDSDKKPIRIIKVWQKLYKKHPDWNLQIVGDGPERNGMENYVQRHHIERVSFEGAQTNVERYYQKATFICLTSNLEGLPMVLLEGIYFGCIPFTFNSYSAASDIIDDNKNGCIITPFNINEYAKKLSDLMDNAILRNRMAAEARKKINDFSIKNVVNQWEDLFNSLVDNG